MSSAPVIRADSNHWTRPAVGGTELDALMSDTVDLESPVRGLMVEVSGDVKVKGWDDSVCTWPALAAGVMHPICAKRIYSTGTTATGIVGGNV
jgi:hypothetical protein